MATNLLKKLTYDGKEVVAEVAIRDGNGNIISTSLSEKANLKGGNTFNDAQIIDLGTTRGAFFEVKGSGTDQAFVLTRNNGARCILEAGNSIGLFGTRTNHPIQIRTNYTTRMTIGIDGSVVLASDVATNSNNNQVATTKWVNNKLPKKTSDLTNDSNFIDNTVNNLIYYTKASELSAVALSGSYNDLLNLPTLPTKTSDLTNDSGFITSGYHDSTKQDISTLETDVKTFIDKNYILSLLTNLDEETF